MAKITFKGVPGESHDTISQYGVLFPRGKAVDVSGKLGHAELRKLKSHPHFEVEDDVEDAVVKSRPPPVDDAFVAVGSTRFSDGKVQTEESLKAAQTGTKTPPTRFELEQLAEAIGVKVDKRWSDATLIAETEKAAKAK